MRMKGNFSTCIHFKYVSLILGLENAVMHSDSFDNFDFVETNDHGRSKVGPKDVLVGLTY